MAFLAAAAALTGCRKVAPQPGTKLDTAEVVGEGFAPGQPGATSYESNGVKPMKVGAESVSVGEVTKLVRPADNVYFYADVRYVDSAKGAPATFGALVDSLYAYATDRKVNAGNVNDMSGLVAEFDAIGTDFTDSVAPAAAASVTKAFNVTFVAEPVRVTDDYSTSKVYTEFFGGGAHPVSDVYYLTMTPEGKSCDFDALVKKEYRMAVREALVQTIAQANGMDVEKYLASFNDFMMVDKANEVGVENFPIYNVGLTEQGLVFSYPQASIAPSSDGVLLYALPTEPLKDILTVKP